MVDYVKAAATAERLITSNGRSINFIRNAETAADPLKPWNGPGDETTNPPTIVPLYGVFVPPNTVRQFGITSLGEGTEFKNLVTFSEQIAIVFPEDYDLRTFTHIEDGVRWRINGIQVLQPGDLQILAYVGMRR